MRRSVRGFRRPPFRRGMWAYRRPFRGFMWRTLWWYPFWWRPMFCFPWALMMGGFSFFLYDTIAYKLHRNDVERIEQEMGKPVQKLTEADLVAAMKRLDITNLEISPKDKEAISNSKNERVGFCIYCKTPVSFKAVYCSQCGQKLKST